MIDPQDYYRVVDDERRRGQGGRCGVCGSPTQNYSCPQCRVHDARRGARELALRLQQYRALPAGTFDDLIDWYYGRKTVADGVTHQFWNITNSDVARFLSEVFGPFRCMQIPGRSAYNCIKMNGERWYCRPARAHHYDEPSRPKDYHFQAGPNVRFNDEKSRADSWHYIPVFGDGDGLESYAIRGLIEETRKEVARRDSQRDYDRKAG